MKRSFQDCQPGASSLIAFVPLTANLQVAAGGVVIGQVQGDDCW